MHTISLYFSSEDKSIKRWFASQTDEAYHHHMVCQSRRKKEKRMICRIVSLLRSKRKVNSIVPSPVEHGKYKTCHMLYMIKGPQEQ